MKLGFFVFWDKLSSGEIWVRNINRYDLVLRSIFIGREVEFGIIIANAIGLISRSMRDTKIPKMNLHSIRRIKLIDYLDPFHILVNFISR